MYIIKNIVAKTGYLRSGMAKYCYKFPNTVISVQIIHWKQVQIIVWVNSNITVQCWHFKMWYFQLFFLYYRMSDKNRQIMVFFLQSIILRSFKESMRFFFTNGYLSLKFEHFAVLSKNIRYYFDNKNFIR